MKYKTFTETNIKRLPFAKGGIYYGFTEIERRLLLDWAISAKQADLDEKRFSEHEIDYLKDLTEKQLRFYWNRIIVKLKGYKIDRSNLDLSNNSDECSSCGREFTNLLNHRGHCKGATFRPDTEILQRIARGM